MKIRAKLLLASLPLAALSGGLMTWSAGRAVTAVLVREVGGRGQAVAAGLADAPGVLEGVLARREMDLLAPLQSALKGGAAYAVALDDAGRVVAHTNVAERGRVYRDEAVREMHKSGRPQVRRVVVRGEPMLEVTVPLVRRPARGEEFLLGGAGGPAQSRAGIVRVGLSLDGALATAASISRQVLWIILGIGAVSLSVILALAGAVLSPVRRLTEATRRLAEGRLGEQVSATSGDELGDLARSFNRMSADLARVTVSREYLGVILDNLQDGLIVTDGAGRVRLMNPGAVALLGGSAEAWTGRPAAEVFAGPAPEGIAQASETVVRSATGEEIPVLCSVGVLSGDGQERGRVIALRDIRARKRAEENLARQSEELARSNQDLEQFAYVASHDLQEPLRKVASYTELLAKKYAGRLDAQADQYIRYAVDGALRMQALITDLLTYSRIGRGEFPVEPVNMDRVRDRALEPLEPRIQESRAQITSDRLPVVMANPTQMEQLLQNLISNALKFRGPEPPRIHIGVKTGNREWRFSVRDNGMGIEPQYAERVFVIFQRLMSRRDYPGTGIGLAICKKIVERHGGKIWVESAPGEGATFYFTLPGGAGPGTSPARPG